MKLAKTKFIKQMACLAALATALATITACSSKKSNEVDALPTPNVEDSRPPVEDSQPPVEDSQPPSIETPAFNFQQHIDSLVSDTVAGIVLFVETPTETFHGSAGYSDRDSLVPMPINARMPIGSAGKKYTALLVAMLHEEGLLDINNTLDTWLSADILDRIPNARQITLRQLLDHSAGIYDYLDDPTILQFFDAAFAQINEVKTDSFALQFILDQEAYFDPGTAWHYSNSGYILAGLVLKEVLGHHASVAMRARILDPFELHNTNFSAMEADIAARIPGYYFYDANIIAPIAERIAGYLSADEKFIETKALYEGIGVSDAPVVSDVKDLARFLKTVITDTDKVSQSVRNTMVGAENLIEIESGLSVGLGLFKERMGNHIVYHHGGLEYGYSTSNIYIPSLDVSITAFMNCGGSIQCELEQTALIDPILENFLF